jgi:hypothetical protein
MIDSKEMMLGHLVSIRAFEGQFPDDKACLAFLFKARWPGDEYANRILLYADERCTEFLAAADKMRGR